MKSWNRTRVNTENGHVCSFSTEPQVSLGMFAAGQMSLPRGPTLKQPQEGFDTNTHEKQILVKHWNQLGEHFAANFIS